jgi:hypothetical protein
MHTLRLIALLLVLGFGHAIAGEPDSSQVQNKIELATQLVQIDGSVTAFDKERQFAENRMRDMGATEKEIARMRDEMQPMVDLQLESLIQAYTEVATIAELKAAIEEMHHANTAVALYERVFPVFMETLMQNAQEFSQEKWAAESPSAEGPEEEDIDLSTLETVNSNRFKAWLPVSPGAAYQPDSKRAFGHDYPESITIPLQDSLLSDVFATVEISAHVVGDDARITDISAERVYTEMAACTEARDDVESRIAANFVLQSNTDCGGPIYTSEDSDFQLELHCQDWGLGKLSSVTLVMELKHKPTEAFMDKLWEKRFQQVQSVEMEGSESE